MNQIGFVYILANKTNSTVYVGVTSNLTHRIWQHKTSYYPHSFTSKYKVYKLVYFERFHSIQEAIKREKYIKGKSRSFKNDLILEKNPFWNDLYNGYKEEFYGE